MPYVLVAYDISDDRRRFEACEKLKSMGFQRVQRSLYIARGGSSLAKDAARALQRIIDPARDSVVVMVVPGEIVEKAVVLGVGGVKTDERGYAVV